ncbi:MAG: lysophospholipid acyltransferase family protein [Pseudomonadota bacterium]
MRSLHNFLEKKLNSDLVSPTINYDLSLLKKIQHFTEFIFVLLILYPLKIFGYKNNIRIYRAIFGFLARLDPFRKRATANLKMVYPTLNADKLNKIAIECWQNLGNVAVDFSYCRALYHRTDFYKIEGQDILKRLQEQNQNAIFFSGHIATWEIFRIAAHHSGTDCAMIYRAFNNPLFDMLARYNMDYGFAPVFQKGSKGVKNMMRYLKNNGNILILTDQYFSKGLDIPFFGRNAKTAPSAAEISLKYNLPLVPVFVRRDGLGKFIISIHNPLEINKANTTKDQQVTLLLEKMNKTLEKHIQSYPEQWFWLHRRWKGAF